MIRTDAELKAYLLATYGVVLPDTQVCPHHTTPFRAFADAYFARFPVSVWIGSRGFSGKSFALALLGHLEATTLAADVTVLGGSGEQSTRVLKYMDKFWSAPNAPRHLLASDPAKREARMAAGNTIQALMASQRSVRGPHPVRLRCVSGDSFVSTPSGVISIRNVKIGDCVFTVSGDGKISVGRVSNSKMTGIRRVINIHVSDGRVLSTTDDHKILTSMGWKNAGQITPRDKIACLPGLREETIRSAQINNESLLGVSKQKKIRERMSLCGLWKKNEQERNGRKTVYGVLAEDVAGKETTLPGLWKAAWLEWWEAMSRLLQQVSSRHCVALHRLRSEIEAAYAAMQDLSSEIYVEHAYGISNERIQGDGYEKQGAAAIKSRNGLQRIIGFMASVISRTSGMGKMDIGFCCGGTKNSSRGERGILAQSIRAPGEGCSKKNRVGIERLYGGYSEAINSEYVVDRLCETIRVSKIEHGCIIDVWDITVPNSRNFFVNGMAVHNCDEIDEMDLDILNSALGQPMSARGVQQQTVLSSTFQYPDGTMADVLRRAKDNNWSVNRWCWRETIEPHGWLSQSEVDMRRSMIPDSVWRAEYDLYEPSPEDRAIVPASVENMFATRLGKFDGAVGEYIEIEPPVDGATYATGADWAKKQDWTIILTLRCDCNPMRVVAFERTGRLPWPLMVERFDFQVNRYRADAAHDATGIGDVVDSYISVPAEPFIMVGRARSSLISNAISAIERGEIKSPDIEFLHGELKYATTDDVYGSGHLPDSLCALALAYYCGQSHGVSVGSINDAPQAEDARSTITTALIDAGDVNGYTERVPDSAPDRAQPSTQMAELAYTGTEPHFIYIGNRPVHLSAGWSQTLDIRQAKSVMEANPGQFAILGFDDGV